MLHDCALQYEGSLGTVVKIDLDARREREGANSFYKVRSHVDDSLLMLHPSNVSKAAIAPTPATALPFLPGSIVKVVGLKQLLQYEGALATVLQYKASRKTVFECEARLGHARLTRTNSPCVRYKSAGPTSGRPFTSCASTPTTR